MKCVILPARNLGSTYSRSDSSTNEQVKASSSGVDIFRSFQPYHVSLKPQSVVATTSSHNCFNFLIQTVWKLLKWMQDNHII
jgi:hypothetical protein